MIISVYSFVMAMLWFTSFVVIAEILRRKTGFLIQYTIGSMLFLITICVVRICIPIETPATIIVRSETIFVSIQHILMQPINIAGREISLLTLLLSIWAIGSSVQFLRFALLLQKDSQTVRSLILSKSENADVKRVASILAGIAMYTPMCQRYQLIMSPKIPTPMVTGLFVAKILLPQTVAELSDEELYHVLMHEWHHLLGRDIWIKCLVELLRCLVWWNPVVYLLKNSVEQSLEIKCDLNVTRHMDLAEKADYLQTIMLFVTRFSSQQANILASSVKYMGITEDFAIRQRFHMVGQYQKTNRAKPFVFVMAMSLLLILSYSFVIQPYTPLPANEVDGQYVITPDNAHILALKDGTFELFVDGEFLVIIPEEALSQYPHDLLPVIYE